MLPPVLFAEYRDLLPAAVVTQEWNEHRNKSQRRKLTPEKKFLPPLLPGLELETFLSRIRRPTAELSPLVQNLSKNEARPLPHLPLLLSVMPSDRQDYNNNNNT